MASTASPAPTATKSPARKTTPKKAATPKKSPTPKNAPVEKAPPRFDPAISAAVRYARQELHAARPNRKPDSRPPAASGGDHVRVRARVTEMVSGPVTPEKVLSLTGLSFPKLVEIARFAPGTQDDMKKLVPLSKEFSKDANKSWRSGRYLAGIIASWVVELRAAKPKRGK